MGLHIHHFLEPIAQADFQLGRVWTCLLPVGAYLDFVGPGTLQGNQLPGYPLTIKPHDLPFCTDDILGFGFEGFCLKARQGRPGWQLT